MDFILFCIFSQDETGDAVLKRCIFMAYLGLFITFALSFLGAKPEEAGPTTTSSPLPAAQTSPKAHKAPAASPAAILPAAANPAPERIMVQRGEEIIEMELEEYVLGVLAAEMPAEFEPEALKAQAVAARSYTLYCKAGCKHGQAMVCCDFACCQAWRSTEEMQALWGEGFDFYYEKLSRAVEETQGQHLLYDEQPVFAAFHSSSAGYTESCGAIWSELPYLVSVESPENESHVPGYVTYLELSPLDFRDSLLHKRPEADFSTGAESWIGEIGYEDSGRISYVVIGGIPYSGTELRSLFSLRSTSFSLEYTGESFLFTVQGFGHGVGMSQYGANVMAQEGADYAAILAHYYPGTELLR